MKKAIITKKSGMTSLFDKEGNKIAVTILSIIDYQIIKTKNLAKDKYNAVIVNYGKIQKKDKITKPMQGYFKNFCDQPKQYIKELKLSKEVCEKIQNNKSFDLNNFETGEMVDATSISIGKGFAGPMKRHNFRGLEASHGVSVSHRSHGSTGGCQKPGKVFKNKKMAGHMGNKKTTIQNIKIFKIDKEKKIIILHGSVPGAKGTQVLIKDAIKKRIPYNKT